MKAHSEALRRRWADPAYREKQTAANRRTAETLRERFSDPHARARLGATIKHSKRSKRGRR
jgi:hypothetical protein